ncbi:MAG TPA: porin family protein [bacterium]|nr:porin family protein [bacterium]
MRLKLFVAGLALALAALLGPTRSNAQDFNLGLEAGANFSNFLGDVSSVGNLNDQRLGFIGGGYLSLNFGKSFSIRPEVLYEQKGAEISGTSSHAELDYIEIPVLLKFGLGTPVINPSILLGASVGWNVLARDQSGDISNINQSDVALIGGLELDIDRFNLSGRYELGVENVAKGTNAQNGTLTFLAGYSLF